MEICFEFFIVTSEILFIFAMQGVSMITKTDVGYELTMKFGNPVYLNVPTWVLFSAAFLAIFFGWLADGLVGKCYVILFGLICAFGSCLTPLLYYLIWDDVESEIMLRISGFLKLAYTSTSGVRNAAILEQIYKTKKVEKTRTLVGLVITVRILVYSVYNVFQNFDFEGSKYFNFSNVTFILIYLLSSLYFIHKMYIESTFLFVWEKCIKCVIVSFWRWSRKVMKIEKKLSFERPKSVLRKSDSSGQKSKRRVKFEAKVQIRHHRSSSSVPSEAPDVSKSCWGYRLMKKPIEETPKNDQTESLKGVEAESSTLIANLGRIFSRKDLTKEKPLTEEEPDKKIIIRYWLDHSKPICSEFTIFQTRKFIFCIPLIIPPFVFTLFIFVILSATEFYKKMTIRSSYLTHTISEYNFYFDAFLVVIFEWIIRPFAPKTVRGSHFILMAYGFLLMATFTTVTLQMNFETNLEYMPFPMYSQLRLYNSLPTIAKVDTSWDRTTYAIAPYQNVLLKNIPVGQNHSLQVKNGQEIINMTVSLDPTKTKSYTITNEYIFQNFKNDDPSFYVNIEDTSKSYIFLVNSAFFVHLTLEGRNSFTYILDGGYAGTPVDVVPQFYNVSMTTFPGIHDHVGFIDIAKSTLYSYHILIDETKEKALLSVIEGPLTVDYYVLLVPLFFLSLSNIFCSGYYHTIVFLNSPEKLRATLFSAIVAMNLLATSLFITYSSELFRTYKILLVQMIIIAFLAFGHIIVSPKFETYE